MQSTALIPIELEHEPRARITLKYRFCELLLLIPAFLRQRKEGRRRCREIHSVRATVKYLS